MSQDARQRIMNRKANASVVSQVVSELNMLVNARTRSPPPRTDRTASSSGSPTLSNNLSAQLERDRQLFQEWNKESGEGRSSPRRSPPGSSIPVRRSPRGGPAPAAGPSKTRTSPAHPKEAWNAEDSGKPSRMENAEELGVLDSSSDEEDVLGGSSVGDASQDTASSSGVPSLDLSAVGPASRIPAPMSPKQRQALVDSARGTSLADSRRARLGVSSPQRRSPGQALASPRLMSSPRILTEADYPIDDSPMPDDVEQCHQTIRMLRNTIRELTMEKDASSVKNDKHVRTVHQYRDRATRAERERDEAIEKQKRDEERWKRFGLLNDELERKIRYYENYYGELKEMRKKFVPMQKRLEELEGKNHIRKVREAEEAQKKAERKLELAKNKLSQERAESNEYREQSRAMIAKLEVMERSHAGEIEELQRQMALQAQRLEAAQKEVSRASGAERQKEATARDLETQVAELQKEVQQFRAKLQDCNTKLKAATERADEGDRDAQQLADQVLLLEEQMEMERKTQSGTSSELQRQVKDLQDELRDKTRALVESNEKVVHAQKQLAEEKRAHVSTREQLEQQVKEMEADMDKLIKERDDSLEAHKTHLQSVRGQLDGSSGKIRELMSSLDAKDAQISALEARLTEESASHAAAMALLEEKIRSLEAETATLAQERDSALYDQQEQVQSVQRQLDGSAGKIKELMTVVDSLQAQLEEQNSRSVQEEGQTEERVRLLRKEIESLQGQIRSLKESQSSLEGDLNACHKRRDELEHDKKDYEAELSYLQEQISALEQINNVLREEVAKLKDMLEGRDLSMSLKNSLKNSRTRSQEDAQFGSDKIVQHHFRQLVEETNVKATFEHLSAQVVRELEPVEALFLHQQEQQAAHGTPEGEASENVKLAVSGQDFLQNKRPTLLRTLDTLETLLIMHEYWVTNGSQSEHLLVPFTPTPEQAPQELRRRLFALQDSIVSHLHSTGFFSQESGDSLPGNSSSEELRARAASAAGLPSVPEFTAATQKWCTSIKSVDPASLSESDARTAVQELAKHLFDYHYLRLAHCGDAEALSALEKAQEPLEDIRVRILDLLGKSATPAPCQADGEPPMGWLLKEVFLYCENCVRRQLQVVDVNAVVEHKFLKAVAIVVQDVIVSQTESLVETFEETSESESPDRKHCQDIALSLREDAVQLLETLRKRKQSLKDGESMLVSEPVLTENNLSKLRQRLQTVRTDLLDSLDQPLDVQLGFARNCISSLQAAEVVEVVQGLQDCVEQLKESQEDGGKRCNPEDMCPRVLKLGAGALAASHETLTSICKARVEELQKTLSSAESSLPASRRETIEKVVRKMSSGGAIAVEKIQGVYQALGMEAEPADIQKACALLDSEGRGSVLTEHLTSFLIEECLHAEQRSSLLRSFLELTHEKDTTSQQELEETLGRENTEDLIRRIQALCRDPVNPSQIDYKVFLKYFQSEGGGSRSRSSVSHRSRFWSSTVGEGHSAMSMAGSSSS